jgi:ATP-dependent Clp protease ATP-binding subunit ClpA
MWRAPPVTPTNALYCIHHTSSQREEITMASQFERFTEQSRRVFSLAQEEAQRLDHNYIGTEHLLLGLIREHQGIAARVLANLGVDLANARNGVELIIGRGSPPAAGGPGLTPRAKKVIQLAMDEARQLDSHDVGTEHLLLGLVREGGGIAAGVLESLGAPLANIRQATLQALSAPRATSAPQRTAADVARAQEMSARRMWKMLLAVPDAEFERLARLADAHGRPLRDLIRDAIRRTWLADEGNTEAPSDNP